MEVGLLAVGGKISLVAGASSATMNFLEQDYWAAGLDVSILIVGEIGSSAIQGLRNNKRLINWTEQVILESTYESSINIADLIREKLQTKK